MSRAFRPTAALLCILLLTSTHASAGPVVIHQVIQVLSVNQSPVSLRLQNTHQTPGPVAAGISTGTKTTLDTSDTPGSVISGVSVVQDQQTGIEVIGNEEVDGTICDCGEILIAGAGFKKWPLFLLAAVPLIFIPWNNPETPTPTPLPTPTISFTPQSQPVPEPATVFLLGSGLVAVGAGLRRRRARGLKSGENKES